jgi:DNA (cytosine-5)-methyltransferase 1
LSLFDVAAETAERETMWSALWRNGHEGYGSLDDRQAVLWVKNVVRPHDEPVTWTLHRPAPTIGAHQAAKLAIAPFGVPEAQLSRQQWHVLGRRQGDSPPVPVEHAYLSDEELLVFQGFPRSWYLHGTRMQRAFQIGNAVPPLLARAVGEAIRSAISNTRDHARTTPLPAVAAV